MRKRLASVVVAVISTLVASRAVAVADPCSERGKELGDWLLALRNRLTYRPPFVVADGQALVAADPDRLTRAMTWPEAGILVELDATELRYRGRPLPPAELSARLRADKDALSRLPAMGAVGSSGELLGGLVDEPSPTPATPAARPAARAAASLRVLLAVAPEVPWSRVVVAATAARDGGADQLGFAFAVTGRDVVAPGPSPIDARLAVLVADTDPARRATGARTLLDEVVARCPDARSLADASSVAYHYADDVLARCQCAIDLSSLRAFAWFMNHVERPVMTVYVPARGRRAAKAAFAGATPWAKVAPRLLPRLDAGRPLTLVSR